MAAAALGATPALAQSPPAADDADEAEEEAAPAPEKKDEDILKDVDIDKLDWSQLNIDASMLNLPSVKARAAAKGASDDASWSSTAGGNGARRCPCQPDTVRSTGRLATTRFGQSRCDAGRIGLRYAGVHLLIDRAALGDSNLAFAIRGRGRSVCWP